MLVSCNGSKRTATPSVAFTDYVTAYTGGSITAASAIRIEFVSPVDESVEPTGLFTFSPSVKGAAHWTSPTSVEFIPESLKPGTLYKAKFKLSKVMAVNDESLHDFNFSFMVACRQLAVECGGLYIDPSSPKEYELDGIVRFSEPVTVDDPSRLVSVKASFSPEVCTNMKDEFTAEFCIKGIRPSSSESAMDVVVDASEYGFAENLRKAVTIPSSESFSVISAELSDGDDPYVDVRFSAVLDEQRDYKGLVELTGVERSYMDVKGNCVKVYFDRPSENGVTVNVSSLLRSASGIQLSEDFSKTFCHEALAPAVSLAFRGSILSDVTEMKLPFRAIGLSAVDVSVIRVFGDNILMYLQDNDLGGDSNLRRSGRLVYRNTVRLDSEPGKDLRKWQDFSMDLTSLFKQEPGAIYRIRLSFRKEYSIEYGEHEYSEMVSVGGSRLSEEDERVWDTPSPYYYESFYDWAKYDWKDKDDPSTPSYYMVSDRFPECSLFASDVGIIAKSSDSGDWWLTVNSISDTSPIDGAEIVAYNYQLREIGHARTDREGFAQLHPQGRPFAFVVRKGNRIGYLKVIQGEEKSLSRFDVGGKALSSGMKGYIYGERGVWRPGDTLHLSLMVEERDKAVPVHHPVIMELYTPQGQFYAKYMNTSSLNGLYVFDVPTRQDDPTGNWNAYFKLGGATFHKSLPVETVKANRLKVSTEIASKIIPAYDVTDFNVSSHWLTGPVAAGLKTTASMTLTRRSAGFKGFEGYSFISPISDFRKIEWELFTDTLDDRGKATVRMKFPPVPNAPGMLDAYIVTQVHEPGGDASVAAQTALFSPYRSYVGVKLPSASENLETDTDLRFPVVTVNADGRVVSGDKVEYSIYKLDWSWWWESSGESLDSYVNGSGVSPISHGSFTSSATAYEIPFRVEYPSWGRYLVYVKDITSGHTSGGIVYVDWPSWRGRSDKRDPNSLTMLSFTTDRKEYEVGEDVTVYIPASTGGRALVSVETGSGVISRNWVKTSSDSDTRYSFKLTADMAPNFYIHISLLQNRNIADNDLPVRMYGVQPVMVSDPDSHLEPVLDMPDVIRPQEEFSVKVKEGKGRPMTYTLAVVDEGLLDLTAFKTPDPWASMYAREALGVKTWDLYDDVFGAFSGKFSPLAGIGGDTQLLAGARRDNRFNPVVRFYGPFESGKNGQVHRIKLPMYVGSVRVMVVACQDGAYGNVDKTVPVRSPLTLLPTLPRTLAVGEKMTLPVNVFAMDDNIRDVDISVTTEGALNTVSATSTKLHFSGTGDKIARFTLQAGDKTGTGTVIINARSGAYSAEERIDIKICNPNPSIVKTVSSLLAPGESRKVEFEPFVTTDDARASLTFSNFPSVNFAALAAFAENYSYDCSEQLAACGLVLVNSKPFLNAEQAAVADAKVQRILQELYGRQLSDGGIAYWPGMASSNEWATSMAGQLFVAAAEGGFSVNKGVLASWKRFQKKCVSNYRHSDDYAYYDLQQAYRLYTLALAGVADEAAMNRLKSAPAMTAQARLRLAAAYVVCGKKNVAGQLLAVGSSGADERGQSWYTFGDQLRDKAMMLETEVLTENLTAALPLAAELSENLANDWYGTQTAAFSAVAMRRLSEKIGNSAIDVNVTDSEERRVRSAESSVTENVDSRSGHIIVKNISSDKVYMSFMTRSAAAPGSHVNARNSGIALSVRYTDMSGEQIDPSVLAQGTEFRAEYIVSDLTSSGHSGLALKARVPSGWEIFNDRLFAVVSSDAVSYNYRDIRDDRSVWYFDLSSGGRVSFSMRLQASYEGEYELPSVVCEGMYDPAVFACTASGRAIVRR